AVVQDSAGNTLMVAPGTLPEGTHVSIQGLSIADVGMPPPAPDLLDAVAAFNVDLGGQTAGLPLQLAVRVQGPVDPQTGQPKALEAGTEVFFWSKGTITDEQGVSHDTWWLVDNGFVGADGVARTASPPFSGAAGQGIMLVTTSKVPNNNTGAVQVSGVMVD